MAARWRVGGLVAAVVLLAPFWGGALVANAGFGGFQRHDWSGAARLWTVAANAPGPRGEWARLAGIAAARAGDDSTAAYLAAQAVQAAPSAPLALLQQGITLQAQGQRAAALDAWRQAGAAPYFCTQAAQALYHTTPPSLAQAADAATICTALDPAAGGGWLVLGQAQAALGQDHAALTAFAQAYTTLLEAGHGSQAAVAAATAAEVARRAGSDAGTVTAWLDRARALAPAVCADPARPQDPNLDALCANP